MKREKTVRSRIWLYIARFAFVAGAVIASQQGETAQCIGLSVAAIICMLIRD